MLTLGSRHVDQPVAFVWRLGASTVLGVLSWWLVRGGHPLPQAIKSASLFALPFLAMLVMVRSRKLFVTAWILNVVWIALVLPGIMTNPSSTAALGFIPLLIGSYGLLAVASILQYTIYVFRNSKDLIARL